MKNIVLIGFMGSGKSTVGKELSQKLNIKFIDMDEEIEKKENKSISDIFSLNGENYFRDVESSILKKYITDENILLSTGGGIIERTENISVLKEIGTVVYLKASTEKIIENLKTSDIERPLLKDTNVVEKVNTLMKKRENKYNLAMDFKIDIDDKSVDEVVFNILLNLDKI